MKSAFKAVVEVHERGTRYAHREFIVVVAGDIRKAADRAEKHFHAVYKRKSIPVRSIETVGVENIGWAIT